MANCNTSPFTCFNISSVFQLLFFLVSLQSILSKRISNAHNNFYLHSAASNNLELLSTLQTHELSDSQLATSQEKTAEFLVTSILPLYVINFLKNETQQDNVFGKLSQETQQQNNASQCEAHLQLLFSKLSEFVSNASEIINPDNTWALQMIDSWGKIPEGILSGHVNSYGDWDECVGVAVDGPSDDDTFDGKYCWVYNIPAIAMPKQGEGALMSEMDAKSSVSVPELVYNMLNPLATAIIPSTTYCVPSTCSKEEMQVFLGALYQQVFPDILTPHVSFCEAKEDRSLDTGAKAMIGVLSVLLLFILIGSLVDVLLNYEPEGRKDQFAELKKHTPIRVLLAFSLPTNLQKWQNTSSGEGGFACIHGIRFFSTCWVILSHTVVMVMLQGPSWNTIDINNVYERPWHFYLVLNGFFCVDTFFTMSGLLACYTILKALDRSKGTLNVFKLYIHRYLRLTPTYALIIGVLANLFKYLGSGPYFKFNAESMATSCRKYWWHNLLYFNNIFSYDAAKGEAMCEGESWYIADDMQFFILSPLFVYLLWKWKRIGMAFLASASLASILLPGIAIGTEQLAPTLIFWKMGSNPNPRGKKVYFQPWYRFGPYVVGMWMGYLLHTIGKKPVKLPKLVVIGGWMLCTATALALILGIMPYFDPEHEDSAVWAGIYGGLSRFTWGIVICWIIFACVKGYGGWINSLLSWRVFIPLGRLTFCVYLSSMSIQIMYHMTLRQPMVFDMYHLTNNFFSHLVMSFIVGLIFSMAFESPFIALEKIIFGGRERKPPAKEVTENGAKANGFDHEPPQISTIPRIKPIN